MTKAVTKRPIERLNELINKKTVQEQFKNALGKHSDLFVASLIDVFNSGLTKCDPGLVIQEALKAAVLKLPLAKSLGFAYLVPYSGKPQFQIGYKGMIQLAQRTGKVKTLNDGVIYEGETVDHNRLTGEITFGGEKTSEKAIGYFCYIELTNGFKKTLYWTDKQVIAHAEKYSKSYKNKQSAWFTNPDAMKLKTVWKALLGKYAPMSIEMAGAISSDDAQEDRPIQNVTMESDLLEQYPVVNRADSFKKEALEKDKTESNIPKDKPDKQSSELTDAEKKEAEREEQADKDYMESIGGE